MRRVVLAVLILAASCAGERPTLEDGSAAREVDPPVSDDRPGAGDSRPLRIAVMGEWSPDPAEAGPASLVGRVLADFLFEGLARLDADGDPVPGLAERWFVSDDRLTWTFVLPTGLRDGLGLPITARDIKRSLEAVAARGPADQAATALTAVLGWDDHMNGASGGVAGISAPDTSTLVIRVAAPFELLPSVLASPAFGVTGTTEDGRVRTTGDYRISPDEDDVFVSVDSDASVARIELVRTATDPTHLVRDGLADWAVLPPDAAADDLPADVIRQPLELQVVLVARLRSADERLGLLGLAEPLLLATEIDGLSPRVAPRAEGEGVVPAAALLDIPSGLLEPLGAALISQLEEAGVDVLPVISSSTDFAARVASGDAVFFPAVMAGGTGGARGLLRLATPGAVDDVFGPESQSRAELAAAVAASTDPLQRGLFADALERALIDDGYLLPVGVFEVRVAVATRVDGLHHRVDGTVDLTGVSIESGSET